MTDRDGVSAASATAVTLRRLSARGVAVVLVALGAVVSVPAFGLSLGGVLAAVAGALVVAAWPAGGPSTIVAGASVSRSRPVWPDPGMRIALEAIEDPCFLSGVDGVLRFQNRTAAARFGAARPGDPLSFKLRAPDLLAAVEAACRGETPQPVRFTERVPTERVYAATVSPLRMASRDGRPGGADFVLVRLVDETEQARLERTRADFVANASHELRTPLASLTGFIETLLGPAREDAVNRERFLRIMLEQAQRMARLIDDLLSLSRIEMKAPVAPGGTADLSDVAANVAGSLSAVAAKTGASITLVGAEAGSPVRGERDELIQVVANLVENAIKYGREGGTVEIAIRPDRLPNGEAAVALSVADDGPGIAAEHLPRLTERFYRVDADQSRRQKGTGLGLAIVKHIVARHRGRLSIRSKPGEGTTVSVLLPAATLPDDKAAGPSDPASGDAA